MNDEQEKNQPSEKYEPPMIIEKRGIIIELFSGEPPLEPPWPGP